MTCQVNHNSYISTPDHKVGSVTAQLYIKGYNFQTDKQWDIGFKDNDRIL
jgi:hypothetical protein